MTHTYFLAGRHWHASGTYYDENGRAFELSGLACVSRSESEWTLDGHMEVKLDTPVRFGNRYQIFETDSPLTYHWTSFNPTLGTLCGTFEMLGDSIISVYTSECGEYSGTETLIRVDEHTYRNAGVSFHDGTRMSAWTAVLKSQPAK